MSPRLVRLILAIALVSLAAAAMVSCWVGSPMSRPGGRGCPGAPGAGYGSWLSGPRSRKAYPGSDLDS